MLFITNNFTNFYITVQTRSRSSDKKKRKNAKLVLIVFKEKVNQHIGQRQNLQRLQQKFYCYKKVLSVYSFIPKLVCHSDLSGHIMI